jgi:hypothetical protein
MICARHALFRPMPVFAVAALVINDHIAKRVFHNTMTGKISDISGMIFFPVFLWAVIAFSFPRLLLTLRTLLWLSLLTATVFSLVKVWLPANALYGWGVGMLQWPFRAAIRLVHGRTSLPYVRTAPTLLDASDLLATPFAFVCYASFRFQELRAKKLHIS